MDLGGGGVAGGASGAAPRRVHAFPLPHGLPEARLLAAVAGAGFAAGPAHEGESAQLFLDTHGGGLFKSGLRLARRIDDGRLELFEDGRLVAEAEAAGIAALPASGALAERVAEAAGGERLLSLLLVESRERAWELTGPGGAAGRVAIAAWTFRNPHRRQSARGGRLLLVEAEEGEPAFRLTAALGPLAGPMPGPPDPLVAGLTALGLALPGAPVPPELKLLPEDDLVRAARKVLARQAYKMTANLEGTRLDLDPEFLHDLRVATRRSRFALRLLRGWFGSARCEPLRDELRWIGGLLGTVRDLDVFIDRLEHDLARAEADPAAVEKVLRLLHRKRDAARRELVPALDSARFAAVVDGLRGLTPEPEALAEAAGRYGAERAAREVRAEGEAGEPASPEAEAAEGAELLAVAEASADAVTEPAEVPLAAEIAPQLVARAARRVLRWEKRLEGAPSAADLHELRILFKGLRYTCEFFIELLTEEERKLIRALVALQDCLGEHQDAVVAQAELEALIAHRVAARAGAAELLALGGLVQVQRERRAERRAQFDALWRKTRGRVKRLRDAAG
ncbi:MAG: CHAD domain-containing protein [Acidobacteria bacterium]|nr:CHAD domain-containing protein [Acidobacteriota bacterium]